MGFFNAVRDRFLGKRVEKEAQKSRLQSYGNPYTNLGSYYKDIQDMSGTKTPAQPRAKK